MLNHPTIDQLKTLKLDGMADAFTSLIPALGEIIYEYSYRDALRDGVIVPFNLRNVVFEMEEPKGSDS